MQQNPNLKHNPVPVYVITKNGNALTNEGVKFVKDMVCYSDEPNEINAYYGLSGTTGIMAHTGPDLLDPHDLADLLEASPTARVVLSAPEDVILCSYGPGENGLQLVIDVLREPRNMYRDSWTILCEAAGKIEPKKAEYICTIDLAPEILKMIDDTEEEYPGYKEQFKIGISKEEAEEEIRELRKSGIKEITYRDEMHRLQTIPVEKYIEAILADVMENPYVFKKL